MKICENKKFNNGKREVYLFGFKLFSYQKKVNHKILNYFKLFYNIKNQTEYIRSLGVKVGENTSFIIHPHFFSYPDFGSEPFLIEIGNNCRISFGCTFLTHDGGLHSIKQAYNIPHGELQKFGKIIIKDGVFIGCKSIIMPGVTIG